MFGLHTDYGASTLNHELGHNLGLQHASGYLNCPSTLPFENCSSYEEYADPFDEMGSGKFRLLNNYHRMQLGWMPGRVLEIDSPGIYDFRLLSPSYPSKGLTALRIRLKDENGIFTGKAIFLEFRRNAPPFDIFNTLSPDDANKGVTIRFGKETLSTISARSYLIDTTPESAYQYSDAPLQPGRTFTNSYYGLSITTLSTNPFYGARVRVQLTR